MQAEKSKQDAMLTLSQTGQSVLPLTIKQDKAVLEIQVPGGNSNGNRSLKLGKPEKPRNSSSGLSHLIFRHYCV